MRASRACMQEGLLLSLTANVRAMHTNGDMQHKLYADQKSDLY